MNLEKDYGSIPSTESEAYVLGFLGLTTVKANVPAFMHFGGELDSDTQDQLVKIGSELLRGTITPEQYVTKYEKALISALPKDKQKDVLFDDYTKEQLKMRVFYSHGLHSKDRKTLKENRATGWDAIAYDLIDWRGGQVSDATVENTKAYWDEKLPGSSPRERERVIQLAQQLNSDGAEDFYETEELEEYTPNVGYSHNKKGNAMERLKDLITQHPGVSWGQILRYLGVDPGSSVSKSIADNLRYKGTFEPGKTIDPKARVGWYIKGQAVNGPSAGPKPTPYSAVVSVEGYAVDVETYANEEKATAGLEDLKGKTQFQLVKGTQMSGKRVGVTEEDDEELNESILKEAVDYTPKILSFLQANPHATYTAILGNLGVDPKSGSAIPVYHQVKNLLTSGNIQREKVGKGFAYSVAGTPAAPQPATPATTAATTATPSNPVSKYSIREPNRVLQIWGASKQEALNHIDHELEYTEGLLDLSKKPEHKARIEQRVADLKAQKEIIEKGSGVKVAAPTKQAPPPAMGGAAVSQAFKKITKLREQFIALQKTGKFMIGKIYDIAPSTDPKVLAKIVQDDPAKGSRYTFSFYGADDYRSNTVSVFFAGNKAGKVFINDKEMQTKADYAQFLVKKNAKDKKREALINQIKNDFSGWRPNSYQKDDIESDNNSVSRNFRSVGDWRNRPGEEDDDDPIWKNEREVTKNFERWVKQHPWSRYVTPFVDPSEKEWATFGVRLKK